MNKSEIDIVISRALQDRAAKADRDILNEWLKSDPNNQIIFEKLKQEWNNHSSTKKALNEEELIDKIWGRSQIYDRKNKSRKRLFIFRPFVVRIAAVLILLISLAFLLFPPSRDQQMPGETYQIVVKENRGGQKSKIYLTDGSMVWLNANSSIKYKKPFSNDLRTIELNGEAYFEVAPDSTKPFVVRFGNSSVEVLGTSFNISAYEESTNKEISLVEGKINLNHLKQNQILTPGWIAWIDKSSNTIKSFEGDVSSRLAWTRDELVFHDATFTEIFSKLERWYGIEIIVEGNYDSDLEFTGTFKDEYLKNVLENIMVGENMRYKLEGERVIITFN